MTRWPLFLLLAALIVAAGGCVSYQAAPLTPEAVRAALAVPPADSLAVRAKRLRTPALAPVSLDLRDGLTPDEAATVAVLVNPTLEARRATRGAVAAQLFAEGFLPPPQLDASADFPVSGDSTAQTAWGLGLSLNLGALITRRARLAAATSIRDSTDLGIAYAEWQTAAQARLAAYRVLSFGQRRALMETELGVLRATLDLLNEAERRRLVTEVDRAAAEAAFRDARLTALDLAEGEATARLDLVAAIGFPADTTLVVQPGEVPDVAVPTLDRLTAGLDSLRLDLRALRLGYTSAESGLQAAVLGQFPAVTVGLNVARSDGGLLSVGPAVSLGLPFFGLGRQLLFDRNQGAIAVATATRAGLFAEYVARRREAEVDLARGVSAIDFARQRVAATAEAYATRRHLVEIYGQALRFGQADVLTYYTARVDATTLALQLLEAEQAAIEAGIALEVVAGRRFARSPGLPRTVSALVPLPPPFLVPAEAP